MSIEQRRTLNVELAYFRESKNLTRESCAPKMMDSASAKAQRAVAFLLLSACESSAKARWDYNKFAEGFSTPLNWFGTAAKTAIGGSLWAKQLPT